MALKASARKIGVSWSKPKKTVGMTEASAHEDQWSKQEERRGKAARITEKALQYRTKAVAQKDVVMQAIKKVAAAKRNTAQRKTPKRVAKQIAAELLLRHAKA